MEPMLRDEQIMTTLLGSIIHQALDDVRAGDTFDPALGELSAVAFLDAAGLLYLAGRKPGKRPKLINDVAPVAESVLVPSPPRRGPVQRSTRRKWYQEQLSARKRTTTTLRRVSLACWPLVPGRWPLFRRGWSCGVRQWRITILMYSASIRPGQRGGCWWRTTMAASRWYYRTGGSIESMEGT